MRDQWGWQSCSGTMPALPPPPPHLLLGHDAGKCLLEGLCCPFPSFLVLPGLGGEAGPADAGCGIVAYSTVFLLLYTVSRLWQQGDSGPRATRSRQNTKPAPHLPPPPTTGTCAPRSYFGWTWPGIRGQRAAQGARILTRHGRAMMIFTEELWRAAGGREGSYPKSLAQIFPKAASDPNRLLCAQTLALAD